MKTAAGLLAEKWGLGPPWCQCLIPGSAGLRKVAPSRLVAVSHCARVRCAGILPRRLGRCCDVVATTKNVFSWRTRSITFSLVSGEISSENISGLLISTARGTFNGTPHVCAHPSTCAPKDAMYSSGPHTTARSTPCCACAAFSPSVAFTLRHALLCHASPPNTAHTHAQ